jgi:hypothetical protein
LKKKGRQQNIRLAKNVAGRNLSYIFLVLILLERDAYREREERSFQASIDGCPTGPSSAVSNRELAEL